MFLFNQRLLPTKTRCHRLDSTMDQNCQFCKKDPETDEHLMIHCHLRQPLWSWLEETARLLGCRTNPDEIIRGHIGPTENLRTIFTLVASYIFTTWKERSHQRIPRRQEVENFWELENYFDISTPYIICIICFCLFCRLLPYNEISCCLFIPFLDIVCSPPDLLFILFIFVILVCTRIKMK